MSALEDRVQELEDRIGMMEPALHAAQASQGVHEFMIVHLLSHLASITEDRDGFIAAVLQGVEMSMELQADSLRKQYGQPVEKSLNMTMQYFDKFKSVMLSTVEVPGSMAQN